jgi:hypothetical protein
VGIYVNGGLGLVRQRKKYTLRINVLRVVATVHRDMFGLTNCMEMFIICMKKHKAIAANTNLIIIMKQKLGCTSQTVLLTGVQAQLRKSILFHGVKTVA